MDAHDLLKLLEEHLLVQKHLINIAGVCDGCIEITIQLPQRWNDTDICEKLKDITASSDIPDWIDQDRYRILGISLSEDTEYIMFKEVYGEKSKCKYLTMYRQANQHSMVNMKNEIIFGAQLVQCSTSSLCSN